jgi:hypothetical protein
MKPPRPTPEQEATAALEEMRELSNAQIPRFGFFGRNETPEEWDERRLHELELLGRRVAPKPLGAPDPPPPGPRRSRPSVQTIRRLLGVVTQLGET